MLSLLSKIDELIHDLVQVSLASVHEPWGLVQRIFLKNDQILHWIFRDRELSYKWANAEVSNS